MTLKRPSVEIEARLLQAAGPDSEVHFLPAIAGG
jgi:hypothetical protein